MVTGQVMATFPMMSSAALVRANSASPSHCAHSTAPEHARTRTGHHPALALVEQRCNHGEELGELYITDVHMLTLHCASYIFVDP
jgi:hypothetical protein